MYPLRGHYCGSATAPLFPGHACTARTGLRVAETGEKRRNKCQWMDEPTTTPWVALPPHWCVLFRPANWTPKHWLISPLARGFMAFIWTISCLLEYILTAAGVTCPGFPVYAIIHIYINIVLFKHFAGCLWCTFGLFRVFWRKNYKYILHNYIPPDSMLLSPFTYT